MELITNIEQLKSNMKTLDDYLYKGSPAEKIWGKQRVKLGICFVAYRAANELRFAPSLFIGYNGNNIAKHAANRTKDGRETNPAISAILKTAPTENADMENKYLEYCKKLGITPCKTSPFGTVRKFWGKILER
jgi:5-methylcytosine-specific restriction protein A